MMKNVRSGGDVIRDLVEALPEKYQPIFGHPELSSGSSRGCFDRLETILDVARRLRSQLGRQVRVLDLGCAQGFFSLSLADDGCAVVGADYLLQNIEVCRALAVEQQSVGVEFIHGSIEDLVDALSPGQYDLVLGLSVFHHLVHQHGVAAVSETIGRISRHVPVGLYELAVREEPVYWAPSQPETSRDLLASYSFVRLLATLPTHLSGIGRPFYYASSRYWMLGDDFREFESFKDESHAHAMGSHQDTRRYYFAGNLMLKKMALDNEMLRQANTIEYDNEVAYLSGRSGLLRAPRLLAHGRDKEAYWLLRETLPGRLLSEMMSRQSPYSYERVVDSLLDELVELEQIGLYHNDIRTWNVIVSDSGSANFIDFGAISDQPIDCVWPDHLLLSFLITVREIVLGQVRQPYPTRRPLLDVTLLPARYRAAFMRVLSMDRSAWSFTELKSALGQSGELDSEPAWTILPALNEVALLRYEDALEHERARTLEVEVALQESLSNAHQWFLRCSEREEEIADRDREIVHRERALAELSSQTAIQSTGNRRLAGRLERLGSSYSNMREELEASRTSLHEAHQNAHQWFLRATQLENDLHAVHTSRSWRWTRPFRFALHLINRPRYALRRLLLAAMRRILARPRLARILNRGLRQFPRLHAKLRSVAVNHTMVDETPAPNRSIVGQVSDFNPDCDDAFVARLSIRGRNIHESLMATDTKEGAK